MKKYLNLEGQEIGWLKVLKLTDKKQGTTKLWECVCKCGNIVYKTAGKLNSAKKVCYFNVTYFFYFNKVLVATMSTPRFKTFFIITSFT